MARSILVSLNERRLRTPFAGMMSVRRAGPFGLLHTPCLMLPMSISKDRLPYFFCTTLNHGAVGFMMDDLASLLEPQVYW